MTIRKIIFNGTLGLIFLAAAGFLGYQFFMSDNVKVRQVTIEGVAPEKVSRYLHLLRVKAGDPFWKVSLGEEVARLQKDKWVEAVEVRRELPGTVVVTIQEKKPVALVGDKKGRFNFIDQKSELIDLAQVEKAADLPMMLGENLVKDGELRKKGVELIELLPDEGALSRQDLSHIEFDQQKGFVLTLRKTGIQVQLGKESFPVRIDRARRVVQYLNQHNIPAKKVDADFSKKVLVQTDEKP